MLKLLSVQIKLTLNSLVFYNRADKKYLVNFLILNSFYNKVPINPFQPREAVVQRCSAKKVFSGLRPATLLKKRLWHRCFPANFAKFLRSLFLTEHL